MALSKIESRATNRLFYSHHSFISPAIIIHTPDARIMAASPASRKSHCFFSSLFFSDWLLCVAPMKMRVPALMAPSSVRRIGATSSCLIRCMKWRALRLRTGELINQSQQTSVGALRMRIFRFGGAEALSELYCQKFEMSEAAARDKSTV